jgi:hypothetical protein
MRPNSFAIWVALKWIIVGRPGGQVRGEAHNSSCRISSLIS